MLHTIQQNLALIWSQARARDFIDMLLVWSVIYRVLILVRHTGTVQMLSGLGVLATAYLASITFKLFTFNWILEKFFSNLFLILVILFQAEIRRALAHIGGHPFFNWGSAVAETHLVEEIAQGAIQMAQKKMGALIVIERDINLEYFIEMGTQMDAVVSAEVFNSIFAPTSPLHDGAVILREGRLFAAGCFLPLSRTSTLDKNLGTRHRAAIGLTEETDACVVVISEENRSLSWVEAGQMKTGLDHARLRQLLYECFGLSLRLKDDDEPNEQGEHKEQKEKEKNRWWSRVQSLFISVSSQENLRLNFEKIILNGSYKLIALLISLILWASLMGRGDIVMTKDIPIEFALPPNTTILEGFERRVTVEVAGPRMALQKFNQSPGVISVDLTRNKIGSSRVTLTPQNVEVPFGVKVNSVTPDSLRATLIQLQPEHEAKKNTSGGGKPQ